MQTTHHTLEGIISIARSFLTTISFFLVAFPGNDLLFAQPGPNCTHINASIGADDTARVTVGELVTNASQIVTGGNLLTVEILGTYGQRIFYQEGLTDTFEIALYACPHIGRQLKVNVTITGGTGGACWSYLTFKQGNGPVIIGRTKTVYCFDPLVHGGHIHDVPPQALVPCRGQEDAKFVADWVDPFNCDPALLGMAGNDTAKIIYREYEAFDKDGKRGVGYDTIYVLRLPQITVDNAFCSERDTVYCGQGGKIGPYMVAGRDFEYGAMTAIDRYQAISFVKTKYNPTTRQLEFYAAEFDPKCGVSVHVDAWPVGSGECASQYKVVVDIKQTCWGTPGLYIGPGSSDIAGFVDTYHPKHWVYTRSKTSGVITAMGTNQGDVSVFDGNLMRPNPVLKLVDDLGATSYRLYNGTGTSTNDVARMCVNMPNEGDFSFTISNSDGVRAGYRLNGKFVPLANGAYTLSLEPCDEFCFEDRGADFNVSGLNWVETVVASPLDSIAPGYWRCEFWVLDLDTLAPVVECYLDGKANSQLVHEDTLYIPAGTHECAAHAYLPPVKVVDDWSGVKFVKAIVPGIATVVFERSKTVKDHFESHKQVKIPHGGAIPIYYEAYDSCHNIGYDTCWVKVKDYAKPTAICDKGVIVGLSSKKVWVDASTFDEGSWDNCGVNLLLARRADWYEACIDLCDDYVWCCTNEHYDTLYCSKLEVDKHVNEVEAHYAKYLEWLCNDYVECGPIIYNAWQYALTKYATLYCIDHPYPVDDHYFRKLFEECYGIYRGAYGYTRASNYSGSQTTSTSLNGYGVTFHDLDDNPGVEYYCFDNFKELPGSFHGYSIQQEMDLYEQIGGGWSDAVPFDCEDACSEVQVELLVMDYWCNWSKCWTWVKVEDKTPVQVVKDVADRLDLTCSAYKADKIYYPGVAHPVSIEWIVDAAKEGDETALAELDKLFGGYEKVWRDEYGNVPAQTEGEYTDVICQCSTFHKQEKIYDEHLGYIWKTIYYDSCWYKDYDVETKYGQVVVNCSQAVQCEQTVWCDFDHCGQGYIFRKWKFIPGCPPVEGAYHSSNHHQDTIVRKQLIWVGSNCELEKGMFTKPADVYVHTCGIEYDEAGNASGVLSPEYTGAPEYRFDDDCRIVGISYQDKVFKIVGGEEACYKIVRTWYHIDWCYLGGKPENAYYWWVDPEYHGRTISWEQKIIVVDTVPPVCTFEEDLTTVEAGGCYYTLDQTVYVDDSCGALEYHWELFSVKGSSKTSIETGHGELDGTEASFDVVVSDLVTGSYQLKVRVTDECQNENYCIDDFDVITGKKPTAICITSLTAELTPWDVDQDGDIDTALVTIWAKEFDRSSAPACNSNDDLSFKIELLDGIDDDTFAEDEDKLEVGCDQVGTVQIRMWVIDEKGSFDYCDVLLVVQNNMGGCPEQAPDTMLSAGKIYGNIANEAGNMIEAVQVYASADQISANKSTKEDGAYDFELPMGTLINIEPKKDINHVNGVSTVDLILLQKHILGTGKINTPYRLIAADINHDGFINALDLLEMRQLILGEIDRFSNNESWRFVIKDYEFKTENPQSEAFPERFTVSLDQPLMKQDFIGMKVGDLDLSSDLARRGPRSREGEYVLEIGDQLVLPGEIVRIPIQKVTTKPIFGLQFTLQIDAGKAEIQHVSFDDSWSSNEATLGLKRKKDGMITALFTPEDMQKSDPSLMILELEITKPGLLSEMITLNSKITEAHHYGINGESGNVVLRFRQDKSNAVRLDQNEPNPVSGEAVIRFYLPHSQAASLIFYDGLGRVINRLEGNFPKGEQSVMINSKDLMSSGIIYYELITGEEKLGKKMIVIP